MRKQTNVITITPFYQWLFVIATLGTWLFEVAFEVHQLMSHYTSDGTWVFQASVWIFSAMIFVLSVGFALQLYRLWIQRVFFAALLSAAALSVYTVLDVSTNLWYSQVYNPNHPLGDNASYWQTFGSEWIVMAAVLAVYIGFLLWLSRRKA